MVSVWFSLWSSSQPLSIPRDRSLEREKGLKIEIKENHDFCMKLDLPCLYGSLKIEEFLDWLAEVQRFFDYTKIPEEKQAKFVAYKVKGVASTWWEQVQQARNRSAKSPCVHG